MIRRLSSPPRVRLLLHFAAGVVCLALFAMMANANGQAPSEDNTQRSPDRFANRPLGYSAQPAGNGGAAKSASGPSFTRVMVSLSGVAGLIVVLGWAYRRMLAAQQPKAGGRGVTLVSRSLLTPKHQVLVLRAGNRLLIVGDSGHGMNLLCVVTEPAEMAAILGEGEGLDADEQLRVSAFAAAMDGASAAYRDIPGADSEPVEHPPALAAAQSEVRGLLERVRSLAGQMKHRSAEPVTSRTEAR